ncbi:MAG: zinc metallopeptidase [Candidatus Acetothermia bacterium]
MSELVLSAGLGFFLLIALGGVGVRYRVRKSIERCEDESVNGELKVGGFVERVKVAEELEGLDVREAGSRGSGFYFPGQGLIEVPPSGNSLLGFAVAAHEISHASQEDRWFSLLKMGSYLEPTAKLLAYSFPILLLLGILFYPPLTVVGGFMFLALLALTALEMALEIEASRTALEYLEVHADLDEYKIREVKKLFSWAILTRIVHLAGGYTALFSSNEREVRE